MAAVFSLVMWGQVFVLVVDSFVGVFPDDVVGFVVLALAGQVVGALAVYRCIYFYKMEFWTFPYVRLKEIDAELKLRGIRME